MQEVAEQPVEAHPQADLNPRPMRLHLRTASTPGRMMDQSTGLPKLPTERSNLLKRSQSMINTTETDDHEDGERRMDSGQKGPIAGGSVLGIHNLSIVFPQFLVRTSDVYV
jgi:solute carrier family 45 protein 1/2/4